MLLLLSYDVDIVTRLTEGQRTEKARYNTGSWQTPQVDRRVAVYEKEGGVYVSTSRLSYALAGSVPV